MKTPTAHELATAITRNVDLFWHRHITFEDFSALAMSLWDDARANGMHAEVQQIVTQLQTAQLVAVDARGIDKGTVFLSGGRECRALRVRQSTYDFLGKSVPATEILYLPAGCDTPEMRLVCHGARLIVRT